MGSRRTEIWGSHDDDRALLAAMWCSNELQTTPVMVVLKNTVFFWGFPLVGAVSRGEVGPRGGRRRGGEPLRRR
jgi:hypothetical protein